MPIQLGMGSPVQKPLATSTTTRTIIRRRVINRTSQRASEGDSYEAGNDRASIGRLELARFMAIPNRISVLRDRLEDEVQANIGRGELQLELDRKRTQIQSLRQAKEEYLSHWKYVRALFRDSISKNYGLGDWVASEGGTHSKTLEDRIAGLLAEVGRLESDLAEKRGKIRKAGLQLLALNPLDSNRLENELRQLTLQEEPKFEIRKRIFILEKKAHFIQIKSAQMAAEGIDWGRTASSLLFQDAIAQIEEAHRKLDTCLAAYHQYENQVGSLNPYEPNFSQKYDDYVQQLLESSKTVPNLLAVHKNGFLRVLAAKKREHDWILARRNGAKQIAREALSRLSSLEGYQELRNEASIRVVLSRFQERFDAILTQESFITNEQLASLTPALLCPKINEAIRAIWAEIDEHDSSIFATAVVLGADNQSTLSRLENALQHMPELEQFRERALGARPKFLEELGRKIAEKIKNAAIFGPEHLLLLLGVEKQNHGGNWQDIDLVDNGSRLSERVDGWARGHYELIPAHKIILKAFLEARKSRFPIDLRHAQASRIRDECEAGLEQLGNKSTE